MIGSDHPTAQFRPDLEGLRAVAVMLVLLYHGKIAGLGGGYIGVDVFFVLSGFLITGIIYRELRTTGQVSLTAFYARRARRLLPAAGVVLLVTLAASVAFLPSFRLPGVAVDIGSAAVYLSNMRFGIQANDYFQTVAAPSPVLHFWSLSVEEQFYIFWPAMLVFAHWLFSGFATARARVAMWIVAIGAASLISSIYLTNVNQPWAFFLLPTRAWELAVGGLIAVMARRLVSIPRVLASAATLTGLALVLLAGVLFDDATPFPGLAAIVPVSGAALVIAGGMPRSASPASRLLSLPPLRFLGRISYSLYLWHWPILIFGIALFGRSMALPLVLASIPVAALSQRLIEEPFRVGRFIGIRPSRNLLQAGVTSLGIVFIATVLNAGGLAAPGGVASAPRPTPSLTAAPNPSASAAPTAGGTLEPSASAPEPSDGPGPCTGCTLADLTPPLEDLGAGRHFGGCLVAALPDRDACVLGRTDAETTVVLFGDSHAENWVPALEGIADAEGFRLVALTTSECPPATATVWSVTFRRASPECDSWREAAFHRLAAEEPRLVIMTGWSRTILIDAAGRRIDVDGAPDRWAGMWADALATTLTRLSPLQADLVLLGDAPTPNAAGLDPTTCIAQHAASPVDCAATRATAVAGPAIAAERSAATAHGATFVDPTPWLCDAERCPAVIDRFVVYRDFGGHLTAPFVLSLMDELKAAIRLP